MTEFRLAFKITQDGAEQVKAALEGVSTAAARVGTAGAAPGQRVLSTTLDAVGATASATTTQLDGLANAEGRVGQAVPANATRLGELDRALAGTGSAAAATTQAMLDEARAASALSAAHSRSAQGARTLSVGQADLRSVLIAIETPYERHAAHLTRVNALFEAGALTADQYHRALEVGDAELEKATHSTDGFTSVLSEATHGLVALANAERLLDLGKTAAQMQDMEIRMKGVTMTTGDYAGAEAFLINLAEKHHKTISSLADGYVQLLSLEEDGVLTRQEAQQAAAGLSNEQSRLNATSEQLSQSLFGLGQALSAPIVQFDELHQITDPFPGLLGRMEKSLGLASGSFKDLAEGAGLSRDLIKKGFLLAIKESDGAAERAGRNISSSFRDIQREWELLGKASEKPVQFVVDAVETPGAMAIRGYLSRPVRLSTDEMSKSGLFSRHSARAWTGVTWPSARWGMAWL